MDRRTVPAIEKKEKIIHFFLIVLLFCTNVNPSGNLIVTFFLPSIRSQFLQLAHWFILLCLFSSQVIFSFILFLMSEVLSINLKSESSIYVLPFSLFHLWFLEYNACVLALHLIEMWCISLSVTSSHIKCTWHFLRSLYILT